MQTTKKEANHQRREKIFRPLGTAVSAKMPSVRKQERKNTKKERNSVQKHNTKRNQVHQTEIRGQRT